MSPEQEWFEGSLAERFASQIVPAVNKAGGKQKVVQTAVRARRKVIRRRS